MGKSELKTPAALRIVRSDESSEIEVDKTAPEDYDMKQTNDEFDSTINSEISELTSDAYDGWMGSDTKWRRSPEGIVLENLILFNKIFFKEAKMFQLLVRL